MLFFVEYDAVDACGVEGTGNHELDVGCPCHDVDVLASEFVYDAAQSATFDADACSYGVDAVVVALDGYLGALARDA